MFNALLDYVREVMHVIQGSAASAIFKNYYLGFTFILSF